MHVHSVRTNEPWNPRGIELCTLALASSDEIAEEDLGLNSPTASDEEADDVAVLSSLSLPEKLESIERQAIIVALEKTRYNRTAAAKLLGVSFRALRYRMERLGIKDDLDGKS